MMKQKIHAAEGSSEQEAALEKEQKPDEYAELTNLLKRVQADFENYKKRAEKEKEYAGLAAVARFAAKLLPILDSFELALKNHEKNEEGSIKKEENHFAKGIRLIYAQFIGMLEEGGIRPIEALGKKFDPNYHEVLMQQHSNTIDEDTIVEEFQRGYTYNGFVLRTSKVKINKKEVMHEVRHAEHNGQNNTKQDGPATNPEKHATA